MRVLELFSGTSSVGRTLKSLHDTCEIVSVDILAKNAPTHVVDILEWDCTSAYPEHYFDIVWASPPCTEYSKAKTRGTRNLARADRIVLETLRIIKHFKPTYWFIENPADGGLLKHRPVMRETNRFLHTCCYCRYGFEYRKATNIWTNKTNLNLKMCYKRSTPCLSIKLYGKHMKSAQCTRSSRAKHGVGRGPVRNAHAIPRELVLALIGSMLDTPKLG